MREREKDGFNNSGSEIAYRRPKNQVYGATTWPCRWCVTESEEGIKNIETTLIRG